MQVTHAMPKRGQLRQLKVPQECPADIAALIDRCHQRYPRDRPSALEVSQLWGTCYRGCHRSPVPVLCRLLIYGASVQSRSPRAAACACFCQPSCSNSGRSMIASGFIDPWARKAPPPPRAQFRMLLLVTELGICAGAASHKQLGRGP